MWTSVQEQHSVLRDVLTRTVDSGARVESDTNWLQTDLAVMVSGIL